MTWPPEIPASLKNDQGEFSGAKLVLLAACLLAALWLLRDLVLNRPLSEWHTVLLGLLLVIGLINRISARSLFKVRLGRDGVEFETRGNHDKS